jgi:hypothetical protein
LFSIFDRNIILYTTNALLELSESSISTPLHSIYVHSTASISTMNAIFVNSPDSPHKDLPDDLHHPPVFNTSRHHHRSPGFVLSHQTIRNTDLSNQIYDALTLVHHLRQVHPVTPTSLYDDHSSRILYRNFISLSRCARDIFPFRNRTYNIANCRLFNSIRIAESTTTLSECIEVTLTVPIQFVINWKPNESNIALSFDKITLMAQLNGYVQLQRLLTTPAPLQQHSSVVVYSPDLSDPLHARNTVNTDAFAYVAIDSLRPLTIFDMYSVTVHRLSPSPSILAQFHHLSAPSPIQSLTSVFYPHPFIVQISLSEINHFDTSQSSHRYLNTLLRLRHVPSLHLLNNILAYSMESIVSNRSAFADQTPTISDESSNTRMVQIQLIPPHSPHMTTAHEDPFTSQFNIFSPHAVITGYHKLLSTILFLSSERTRNFHSQS